MEGEQVTINKNRWFYGALAVAVLNPIFAGLILGILMIREPGLKKEGRIVIIFSLAWGIVALLLAFKYGVMLPGKTLPQ